MGKKSGTCIDCGQITSYHKCKRCLLCFRKFHKGINHGTYQDGRSLVKKYCLDCKKELSSYQVNRCRSCSQKYYFSLNKEKHPMKGKHHTVESKFRLSQKAQERLSKPYNNPNWKGGVKKNPHYCIECNRVISYSSFKYGSKKCIFCTRKKGKLNSNYIHGEGNFPYPLEFNNLLKEKIRRRDKYICQNCFITEEEHVLVFKQKLHVHHIDYNKKITTKLI